MPCTFKRKLLGIISTWWNFSNRSELFRKSQKMLKSRNVFTQYPLPTVSFA